MLEITMDRERGVARIKTEISLARYPWIPQVFECSLKRQRQVSGIDISTVRTCTRLFYPRLRKLMRFSRSHWEIESLNPVILETRFVRNQTLLI